MLVKQTAELPISSISTLQRLAEIPRKKLSTIVTSATSLGEALMQSAEDTRPERGSPCHFGVQLGRPMSHGSMAVLPLRWWNDNGRSLTPGFIGELQVRPVADEITELQIIGQYHPQAHLYELVNNAFLCRVADTVVGSFLNQLQNAMLTTPAARGAATFS
jgi:hypothetical protein